MKNKKIYKSLIGVAVFAILAVLPLLVNSAYYITIFNQILIYSIVVFGMNFITGMTGQMNLASAGIMALGGYTMAILSTKLGVSPWIGLIAAVLMGILIGFALGYPSLKLKGTYLALTTLAFTEIVRMLATNLTGLTGGTQGIKNIPAFSIFGLTFDTYQKYYYLVLVFAAFFMLISLRIVKSKWGREFLAVRDNIDALDSLGLDVKKIKIRAFILCAVYTSVAGVLYVGFYRYMNSSTYTPGLSFNFVIMLLLGGIGNVIGNFIGAIIVVLLPELLRFLGDYYHLVFYTFCLVVAMFFPRGIISMIDKVYTKIVKKNKTKKGELGNE